MKKNFIKLCWLIFILMISLSCNSFRDNPINKDKMSISRLELLDKIKGGWAGKMIGVSFAEPVEFRAMGNIYTDSIPWDAKLIKRSLTQDDLYVQLSFLTTMDKYGIGVPPKKYHEMLAKAKFGLWGANLGVRKLYFDSIFPPESGSPKYQMRADDIDFQIEADYIGFMNPGMSQNVIGLTDKIGHIVASGDGVYGGTFIAVLYSYAFFENEIPVIIDKALLAIPAESNYAKIVGDVIALHKKFPDDWKSSWKQLEDKWGKTDISGAGETFNIDAKINGAYVVMGLLYGNGDPMKTMEIAARCGQDADCNAASAMAVLGVLKGFNSLPMPMQDIINSIGDSLFSYTRYSFNLAAANTFNYAIKSIQANGGKANGDTIEVNIQQPVPAQLEISYPNIKFKNRVSIFDSQNWKLKGKWQTYSEWKKWEFTDVKHKDYAKFSFNAGDEATLNFNGTGIAIRGCWVKEGGKADVYIDNALVKTIDTYFFYSYQEDWDFFIFHKLDLNPGDHTFRLVVKGDKRDGATGTKVYITEAQIFCND